MKLCIPIALFALLLVPTGIAYAQAQTFCSSPALAIPDNDPVGATDTLTVGAGGSITDIDVSINTSHTWVGDLIFTVTNVTSAISVTIIDQPGVPVSTFGCPNDDINCTLDDAAANPAENACNATPPALGPGSLSPNNLLAAFNGINPGGQWTLNVSDNAAGDTGTLNQWCLIITGAVPVELQRFTIE